MINWGSEGYLGYLLALEAGEEHRLSLVRRSELQGGIGHLIVVALGTLSLHHGSISLRFRFLFGSVQQLLGIVCVKMDSKLRFLAAVNYYKIELIQDDLLIKVWVLVLPSAWNSSLQLWQVTLPLTCSSGRMEPQEGQNPGQLLKASISKIQIRQIKTKINIFARATIAILIGPSLDR